MGSTQVTTEGGAHAVIGTYESHLRIFSTPSWSSSASWWETPLGSMICGPPSWSCELYTSLPSSLLSAEKPVRMIGPLDIWMTRCARRLMYAPMPTERPVTYESVKVSAYAAEVSPAIMPEPRRFSTPRPSLSPTM